MKANITVDLVKGLAKGSYDVWDDKQPRLVLRVRPSGKHSYLVSLGRGKWYTLGRVADLKPEKARDARPRCLRRRGRWPGPDCREGEEDGGDLRGLPREALRTVGAREPEARRVPARASPRAIRRALRRQAADRDHRLCRRTLADGTPKGRHEGDGQSGSGGARAALSKAVVWNLLLDHPLRRVKQAKEDRSATVRFLSVQEEIRLRLALAARDNARRAARTSANDWRRSAAIPCSPTSTPIPTTWPRSSCSR